MQAIVGAILKAIDYYKQHPEEADRIMAPYFQITPEKFAAILEGVRFADLKRNRAYFGAPPEKGPIFDVAEKASKIWLQSGVINTPIMPDTIITQRFVSEANI